MAAFVLRLELPRSKSLFSRLPDEYVAPQIKIEHKQPIGKVYQKSHCFTTY